MAEMKVAPVSGLSALFSVQHSCFFFPPAPSPTTPLNYLATKCVDTGKNQQETKWLMPWGPNQCDKLQSFDDAMAKRIEANDIVFAVHIPSPNKEMSPWFQFMLVILQFNIAFKMNNQIGEDSCWTAKK
uniref:Wntless GOLD domain-containing protein n=1 Tax=Oryzias latipes TaxID=8090 RepID=A0A3P9HB65_ORYLA